MLAATFRCAHAPWKKIVAKQRKDFIAALDAAFHALEHPDRAFSVAVSLIGDTEMQQLNAQYRHKDKPTNVLSFPLLDDFSTFDIYPAAMTIELGDIVMAYETTAREAQEMDIPLRDHVLHLLVHGMLHLFGYDHMNKKDAREMETLEIDVLAGLGIANPYL